MKVYKYRGGEQDIFLRDLGSLQEDYFWSPLRSNLNDPCEGFVSVDYLKSQLDLFHKFIAGSNPKITESFENVQQALDALIAMNDKAGIYSLSKTPLDELLWAHYANSHCGFCIEYDLDKLMEFGKNDFHRFDVVYEKQPPKLEMEDLNSLENSALFVQKLIGCKSERWAYEKEIRIVTSLAGRQEYDFRAVTSIYFGLRMKPDHKQAIMETLAGRGIKYFQIELANNSYTFSSVQVVDPYSDIPRYRYSIAPIKEWAIAPEYLKEELRQYSSYLYKAAEIVRREPYCSEVEMVEFSSEKSTPGNPVIFVQYKRSENRWVNHYLTLDEIDAQYSAIEDLDAPST